VYEWYGLVCSLVYGFKWPFLEVKWEKCFIRVIIYTWLYNDIISFHFYCAGIDDSSQSSQPATQPNDDDDDDIFCHYSKNTGHKDDPTTKTEIESYFQEDRVPYN
jgi:hypothetical protein